MTSYTVTEELGVSQPSFFYCFPSQAAFYESLMGKVVETNRAEVAAQSTSNDPLPRLAAYFDGNLAWGQKYPEQVDVLVFGLAARGKDSPLKRLVRDALTAGEARVPAIVEDGIRTNVFTGSVPVSDVAYLIHRALLGALLGANGLRDGGARKEQHAVARLRVGELAAFLLAVPAGQL